MRHLQLFGSAVTKMDFKLELRINSTNLKSILVDKK